MSRLTATGLIPSPANQFTDLNWQFAAGTVVNLLLTGTPGQGGMIYGWGVWGELVPAS